ncbi:hypothetical protein BDZ89DRAFT_1120106 [Hymenopellis radicata]|nr:hypothetical protein BDZ89DRAFT_1120106 [Hymenopellis radicata]
MMTGWSDDAIDEEDGEEERIASDGDVLGDVTAFVKRQKPSKVSGRTWEMDPDSPAQHWQFYQTAPSPFDDSSEVVACGPEQHPHSSSVHSSFMEFLVPEMFGGSVIGGVKWC